MRGNDFGVSPATMIVRTLIVCVFLLASGLAHAQNVGSADVDIKLSLAENKTVYRTGEPIKLVLELATTREGYSVDLLPEGSQPGLDTIVISPETGLTHWMNEFADNRPTPRHAFGYQTLTSSPERVEIILNDTLRFDAPGRYSVTIMSRRVIRRSGEQLALATNPVVIEIQPMTEQEEAKEVKRLSATASPAAHLSYLTGDPSTREKVRRLLNSHEQRSGPAFHGLFIARNRSLALKLLEDALNDPAIPVTTELIYTITRLKTLLTHGVRDKPAKIDWHVEAPEHPAAAEIRNTYLVHVAAGLSRRTGKNQTTTALTILTYLQKDFADPSLREVRSLLVQQFDALPYSHEWLLRQRWEFLRDPALVPSLKRLAGSEQKNLREVALLRLMDLAPDEIRSYVLAEIRDPNSQVASELLGSLSDKTLPEVEATLVEQVRRRSALSQNNDFVFLKHKTALLARYATENVYQDVMKLYREVGAKLPRDGRAGLLAYFAKHNVDEAILLIEQALAEMESGNSSLLLIELTRLYYSNEMGALLRKLLESDDPSKVRNAAYLLGKHGSASDQQVLEARLDRWRAQWRDKLVEANAQHQGLVERELVYALINGKSWKLSPERLNELKASCLTQMCKSSIQIQ